MKINLVVIIWLAFAAIGIAADDAPAVRGWVVDQQGRPVADVDVDFFWCSNGSEKDEQGNRLDPKNQEERGKSLIAHLGEMTPCGLVYGRGNPRTGSDGRFSIADRETTAFTLMAMDSRRARGGRVDIPKEYDGSELEIRLGPLVRVHGSFAGPSPDRPLGWAIADVRVPDDPTRPVAFTRLTSCEAYDGRFLLWLPVGRYLLYANNDDQDYELQLEPSRELVLTSDKLDVDLGVAWLTEKPSVRFKERQAKKQGTLGDYTKHYGNAPPRWHAIDARGVSKDVEIDDFKGKWVLLDFWGMTCAPCLCRKMPMLLKFYEEHAADRDRFEILSICIDTEGEMNSMADLDRQLAPIIEHVWAGKTIPFPILLDNTFETWRSFGIPGLGVVLLVDPDGNLVENGDEQMLAEKLKLTKP